MKTRTITKFYLAVAIIGILLALAAKLLLDEVWTNTQTARRSVSELVCLALVFPSLWSDVGKIRTRKFFKQKTIEEKDERNQMIKNKSQAISGEVIHWALMLGAWISIFFDAPLWITLAFVGRISVKDRIGILCLQHTTKKECKNYVYKTAILFLVLLLFHKIMLMCHKVTHENL